MGVYHEPEHDPPRWLIDFIWTDGHTGKKRRIRRTAKDPKGRLAKSKTAAEAHENRIRAALAAGTFELDERQTEESVGVPTLKDYREVYLDDVGTRLKPQTLNTKRRELNALVALKDKDGAALVANRRLDEIDATVILELTKALRARDLSSKSINNVLSALRSTLAHAEEHKLLASVPKFRWQKSAPTSFDFFTFDEANKLIAHAHPMAILAVRTGLRIGELLALKWSDVALDRQQLTVSRSMWWGPGVKKHEGAPKNHRARTVPLTPDAMAALERQRRDRENPVGYVFTDPANSPLTMHACKWPLWRSEDAAGLRRTGWHVLRHTFASHLVMRGAALPAVQQLMGHSTIQMTMKYAHLAPDHLRQTIALLG